jgi:hypothetical protein
MITDTPKSRRKRQIMKALLCVKIPLVFRMMARLTLLRISTSWPDSWNQEVDRCMHSHCPHVQSKEGKLRVIAKIDTWERTGQIMGERRGTGEKVALHGLQIEPCEGYWEGHSFSQVSMWFLWAPNKHKLFTTLEERKLRLRCMKTTSPVQTC